LNGTAYTLAILSTKKMTGEQEPHGWNRISWVFVLGILALVLMAIGGLKAVQTSSVLVSFPMLFIFIIIIIGFFKVIKEDDWGNFQRDAVKTVPFAIEADAVENPGVLNAATPEA